VAAEELPGTGPEDRRGAPDIGVVLFGGPEEKMDNERILEHAPGTRVILAETPGLKYAAALMKKCEDSSVWTPL